RGAELGADRGAADRRPRLRGRTALPELMPAQGPRRAVAGMLTGCVQQVFFPEVNAATARVLAAEGCDVVIPRRQGCCGALSLHAGRRSEAAGFARRSIGAFERAGVDAVVVNVAGCGSAMKEYAELLAGDGEWAERAAAFSAKVRDLPEFLGELGERKARTVRATGAGLLVSANPGCAIQISSALAAQGTAMPMAHIAEVLDASIQGTEVATLLA